MTWRSEAAAKAKPVGGAPIGLLDLIAALRAIDVEPVTLTYEHIVERADLSASHSNLHVSTCGEFRTLARMWRGKRDDREWQNGVRVLYADCGERSLLSHCCHTGLPCWGSEAAEMRGEKPAQINDPDDYDGDLFGGDAA